MKKIMMAAMAMAAMSVWADRTISANYTLSADEDWRGQGTVTIEQGVVVDLAGHSLTVDGFAGYGMVLNSSPVPEGYELLESISATGTQYLDSGLVGKSGVRVEADFSVVDSGGNYVILGAENSSSAKIIPIWVSGSKWYVGYGGNQGGTVAYVSNTRMKVHSELDSGKQLVVGNGDAVVNTTAGGSVNSARPLWIFARNSQGTPMSQATATLYDLKIWQGTQLVRDFRPARRTADGEVGLLDLVEGEFHGNIGEGELTAGAVVATPAGTTNEATLSTTFDVADYTTTSIAIGNNIRVIRRLTFAEEPTPGDRVISWSTIPADVDTLLFDNPPAGVEPIVTTIGLYYGLGTNSQYSCTYKGGDGVYNEYARWNKGADGEMTLFGGQMCYLPANPGRTDTFTYVSNTYLTLYNSPTWVYGSYAFPGVGGFYYASLALFNGSRITFDPVKFALRSKMPPRIEAGAKFALTLNYANYTKGRFLLWNWDSGELDAGTQAALATFFDASTAAAANPQVVAEKVGTGGRLWLDLAPGTPRMRLNVFTTGDSITQGTDGSWGNWRTLLMKRLEAEGYDAMAKGHWKTSSADICGAAMPSNWVWHSGIGSQALITTSGRYGLCDCMENLLDTAGDLDFMLMKIGTNNLNHDTSLAEDLYPHWTNLVFRMLAQKPHAKLIVGAVLNQAMWPQKEREVIAFNTMMANAIASGVFPAKRVYFADLYTPTPRYDENGVYIPESYLSAGDVHPLWKTEDVMAQVWCEAMQRALAEDPTWQGGALESNPTATGAEVNVPAEFRAGFVRARTLDVAAHNHTPYATLGYVPYEDFSASTAATQDISRVGYYLEIKHKNTEFNDYRGLVRYLWVDMDAFGDRTIESVGVPYARENIRRTTRLHVKTNMPGIEETLTTDDSRLGWIEFTPRNYSAEASGLPGAPAKVGPGRDWNDNAYDNPLGGPLGYASMQVHRFTPGAYNPAEVIFAFNGWGTNGDAFGHNFGFGNLGIQQVGCLDWTIYGSYRDNAPLYSVDSYEVAKIEIWTKSFVDDADPYPPQVALDAVEFANGAYSFTGAYSEPGTGGSNVTVRIEWASDAAFTTGLGSQSLGDRDAASALSGTVSGLDATERRYFRIAAVNEKGVTGTSAVIGMDPNSPVVVRATWTGAANNGLATDAANWICKNEMDNTVGGIPGATTKIGSCTLASDCDWRGIDAEIDGVIDLKGHKLSVATLRGNGTITDSTLPTGYQRLEYIRATGTQYLDSGVNANTANGLYAEADFTVHNSGGNYAILGAYDTKQNKNCVLMWVSMSTWYMSYATHLQGSAYGSDARHYVCSTFRNGTQTCYVDGELKVSGTNAGTVNLGRNLYILARNNNGSPNSQALATLYSMKIWDGGKLVRDYVPAKCTSDNAAGLYDLENRTFTANGGSGSFTTGAVLAGGGAPGELHVDVAAGDVAENSTVAITGHVKLVKDGEGVFVAAKADQENFGGTLVAEGLLKFGGTTQKGLFGRNGTEIAVDEGTELDFAGNEAAYPYSYVLNGGTLVNTVYVGEIGGIETLRLTADSSVRFDQVFNFRAGIGPRAQIDLAGYTLTINGTDRWYNADVTEGTLRYPEGSLCHPKGGRTFNGPNVTLDMGGFLLLESSYVMTVSNYYARCWQPEAEYSSVDGSIKINGTFMPTTNQYWGCELQDGSTLDLTAVNGTWSTTSPTRSCTTSKTTVTFANNAHITVDLHGRVLRGGEKVVEWNATPSNLATLTFEIDRNSAGTNFAQLRVENDGIYIYRASTFIFIR